jgi:hypothetical protein
MTQQCCVWTGTAAQEENGTPALVQISSGKPKAHTPRCRRQTLRYHLVEPGGVAIWTFTVTRSVTAAVIPARVTRHSRGSRPRGASLYREAPLVGPFE